MQDPNKVRMVEKVTVTKINKEEEGDPVVETVVQETVSEVSLLDAMAFGFVPKGDEKPPEVEGTGTVRIGDE